jgi:hypothetical protein
MGGGFYNQQGPRTAVDFLGSHPLDVVTVGGFYKANVPLFGGSNVQILAAPPSGFAWAIKTITGDAGCPYYLVDGGTLVIGLNPGGTSVALDGQLATQAVYAKGVASGAVGTAYITYDQVILPVIQ